MRVRERQGRTKRKGPLLSPEPGSGHSAALTYSKRPAGRVRCEDQRAPKLCPSQHAKYRDDVHDADARRSLDRRVFSRMEEARAPGK